MAEQPNEDKIFSKEDVATHNKDGDLWIIVEEKVYDMSSFQDQHPGGKKSSSRTVIFVFPLLSCAALLICVQSSSASREQMPRRSIGNTMAMRC